VLLTVKVALQVILGSQLLVTVNITVFVPPQKLGAPLLLFKMVALQPPVTDAVASQLLNLLSICA
jgi:hypothetical protein